MNCKTTDPTLTNISVPLYLNCPGLSFFLVFEPPPRCCKRARAVRSQRMASALDASDRTTCVTAHSGGTSSPSSSLTSMDTGVLRRPAFPHTFSCAFRYHCNRIAREAALRYTGPQSGYTSSDSSSVSTVPPCMLLSRAFSLALLMHFRQIVSYL